MWSKKVNFTILSTLYLAQLLILYYLNGSEYWWLLISLPLIYLAIFSYISWQIYKDNSILRMMVFTIILLYFGSYLLIFFPTLSIYPKVIYSFLMSVLLYFYLLSLNIYAVSINQGKALPLLQPARLIVFIVIILEVFLVSTIIYKIPILFQWPILDLVVKFIAFLVLYSAIFLSSEWFHKADKIGELTNQELQSIRRFAYASGLVLAQVALVISFYPFEAFGKATFLAAIAYTLTNTVHAYLYHKINIKYFIESASIIIISYALIYFL